MPTLSVCVALTGQWTFWNRNRGRCPRLRCEKAFQAVRSCGAHDVRTLPTPSIFKIQTTDSTHSNRGSCPRLRCEKAFQAVRSCGAHDVRTLPTPSIFKIQTTDSTLDLLHAKIFFDCLQRRLQLIGDFRRLIDVLDHMGCDQHNQFGTRFRIVRSPKQ
jgi:hypothetical protein